jgi:hypothetical protein
MKNGTEMFFEDLTNDKLLVWKLVDHAAVTYASGFSFTGAYFS